MKYYRDGYVLMMWGIACRFLKIWESASQILIRRTCYWRHPDLIVWIISWINHETLVIVLVWWRKLVLLLRLILSERNFMKIGVEERLAECPGDYRFSDGTIWLYKWLFFTFGSICVICLSFSAIVCHLSGCVDILSVLLTVVDQWVCKRMTWSTLSFDPCEPPNHLLTS